MKVVILYSHPKPSPDHPRAYKPHLLPDQTLIFIRSEIVEAPCLSDALDLTKPRPGETVLNTISHPAN